MADWSQPLFAELAAADSQATSAAQLPTGTMPQAVAALPVARRQPHVEALVLRAVRELTGDAQARVSPSTAFSRSISAYLSSSSSCFLALVIRCGCGRGDWLSTCGFIVVGRWVTMDDERGYAGGELSALDDKKSCARER